MSSSVSTRRILPSVLSASCAVWAWRQHRVKKIARSTDLMLTLFPFEARFYEEHGVPVVFVGHPLADTIPLAIDQKAARRALAETGLQEEGQVLALLPGSRSNELHYLAEPFIETVCVLRKHLPQLQVVAPMANQQRRAQFEAAMAASPHKPDIILVDGRSREVMAAADVVLLASGTAALEAMLLKKPMVAAYKLSPITYWLAKRLVKVENVTLPNLLARESLVPELIQHEATPQRLGEAVMKYFDDPQAAHKIHEKFDGIHRSLRKDASRQAAQAVLELVAS
jgi:lipid-A-disaccharide synthase